MPRKADARGGQPQALSQLQPYHRQSNWNRAARAQNNTHIAVARVVKMIQVGRKIQITVKELIQYAQLLQWPGICRHTALHTGQQLIHIIEHPLHIQRGVFILAQADSCLQKGKLSITVNQRCKIFQRCGWFERKVHTKLGGLRITAEGLELSHFAVFAPMYRQMLGGIDPPPSVQ